MATKVHDIDAAGQSLGRIASRVAMLLRGKDKADYEPRTIPDVRVVIHNLSKIVFKGTKAQTKVYYRHSGFPGGLHEMTLEQKWAKQPGEVMRLAVRGMLPPNRSRDRLLKNLSVQL